MLWQWHHQRLLRYFLSLLGDVRRPSPWLGLVRAAVTSEHAAQVLQTFLAGTLLAGLAEALKTDQGEWRMALVASQLVGIAVTRYAVRLGPLTAADDDRLVRWVAPVLQDYLTGERITPHAPEA